jgi:hypothetical protein
MSNDVHFEIFVRRGLKGGWSLLEAWPGERHDAIKHAKAQLGQNGVVAVKVTKETFDEEAGTYGTVSIFEDGAKEKKTAAKDEAPKLPCFKPQDLFTQHSRTVIARVLKGTLDEWQLIPMELVHRADMLEKLEARSTVLQHAVQQVAIAQAETSPGALHETFRQLMDLTLKAIDGVIQDDRKDKLKPLPSGSIVAFWANRAPAPDSGYFLAGAIAKHLKSANGWSAKIRFLLEMMSELMAEEEKRRISAETIDSFVAEMIKSPASISDLLGPREDLGAALYALASLFLGKDDVTPRPAYLDRLAKAMACGTLERSRGALAERILAEIKSPKRFHPASFERELETMRHLAQQLVLGVCPHLSLDAVTEAFATRSKRLVAQDQIDAYLEAIECPEERITRLIALAENLVGPQAKRAVASVVRAQLSSPKLETHFAADAAPILARLRRLAELQINVRKGHFESADARDIVGGIGVLANRIAERAQFFKALAERPASSADRALGLLRLVARGLLPQGECEARSRALINSLMKRPDFAPSLTPPEMPAQERQARCEELRKLLAETGFMPKEAPLDLGAAAKSGAPSAA